MDYKTEIWWKFDFIPLLLLMQIELLPQMVPFHIAGHKYIESYDVHAKCVVCQWQAGSRTPEKISRGNLNSCPSFKTHNVYMWTLTWVTDIHRQLKTFSSSHCYHRRKNGDQLFKFLQSYTNITCKCRPHCHDVISSCIRHKQNCLTNASEQQNHT